MKKSVLLLVVALSLLAIGCPPPPTVTTEAGIGDPIGDSFDKAVTMVNGEEFDIATGKIGQSKEMLDAENNPIKDELGHSMYYPVTLDIQLKNSLVKNYKDKETKYVKFLVDFYEETTELEYTDAWKPLAAQNGHSIEFNRPVTAGAKNYPLDIVKQVGENILEISYNDLDESKITSRASTFYVNTKNDSTLKLKAKIRAVKCNGNGDISDTETYTFMEDIELNFDTTN